MLKSHPPDLAEVLQAARGSRRGEEKKGRDAEIKWATAEVLWDEMWAERSKPEPAGTLIVEKNAIVFL